MQYELYLIEKCENKELYFYRLSTDDIIAINFYVNQIEDNKKYIIIDNYSIRILDNRFSKSSEKLNLKYYEEIIFECKMVKYIDIFSGQHYNSNEIYDLSLSAAKRETDFLLNLLAKN